METQRSSPSPWPATDEGTQHVAVTGLVESPVHWNVNAGFGKRLRGNGPGKGRHRPPGRLHRPPLPLIIEFIEQHKTMFGVEPICTMLSSADVQIAASTFHAARTRPPSARALRDEDLKPIIARVHKENYGVCGIRKMHAQLSREDVLADREAVARCTTQRLMKDFGLRGISRAKGPRTTVPETAPDARKDHVKRAFVASCPDRLWVAAIERHEALLNRAVMERHRRQPVVAGWL